MFYMFLLSAEAVARAEAPAEAPAAAAAVAQQVEQDHAPAPAHDAARLGVSGLGAVGAAGVLQPLQVHPVLGVVGVQLHGTAGIRIQEGTHGVIQMPRCTVAVRRYINAGGLYTVLYDTNSYAGPVASFLGCSPYQYAMRSSNLGFAGRGVIKETTGIDIEPHYHSAYKALARGHIQGVWDRREARANLKQVLLTMGGRNLYYR